jgi:hypothetical protein
VRGSRRRPTDPWWDDVVVRYLVMACRPGRVVRLTCRSSRAAAMASRTYESWGWAVTVFPETTPPIVDLARA